MSTSKYERFAVLAASFVGRRGLLVEYGPTIVGCKVIDVRCDAAGMQAEVVCDDGTPAPFVSGWDTFVFDKSFWQVSYANARIVFDAEAVRRFDAREPLDIEDYL